MAGAIPAPPAVTAGPYDGPSPFYPPPSRTNPNNSLQVPYSDARPRSQPPLYRDRDRRGRRDRRDRDSDRDYDSENDSDHRPRTPLGKAKQFMENNFSDSTAGVGVGVMGAIIGGLAAREATEAASRKGGRRGRRGSDPNVLLSTIVGAAVGGLGANALEKRLEKGKNKSKYDQVRREEKWVREDGDRGGRDRRERGSADDMEEGRAGGGGGRGKDYYDDDSDPDYIYDRRPRRRSDEETRYR